MRLASAVLLGSILAGATARADEFRYPVPLQCIATPESDEARRAIAAYWFEQGRAQVDRSSFSEAQGSFACSLAIIEHPATLYNLARAAEWAGHLEVALRAFREFLELMPDAPNRAEIEELVVDILTRQGLAAATPLPGPPLIPEDEAPAGSVQEGFGWFAVAAALGATVAGTTCGALYGAEPDLDADTLLGLEVSFGIAGGALLSGLLLLLLDDREGDLEPAPMVAPEIGDDYAGLVLVGRF